MIVKNFCRHRDKFCKEILGEDDDKFAEKRLEILKKVSRKEKEKNIRRFITYLNL